MSAFALGLLGLSREVNVSVFDSLWAEDGNVFLPGAADDAGPLEGYRGYFHLAPRLLSMIVVFFNITAWPVAVSVLHLAVVCGLAVFVFFASTDLIESTWLRAAISGWLIVNPVAPEAVANLTNLHWFLLVGAFWAVFAPDRRTLNIAGFSVVAVAALSNPATALVGLISVVRWHLTGARRLLALGVTAVVLSGLHFLAGQLESQPDLSGETAFAAATLWVWASTASLFGSKPVPFLLETTPVVPVLVTALLFWGAVRLTDRRRRLVVVSAIALSLLLILVPSILRGITDPFGDLRLTLTPAALLLTAFGVSVPRDSIYPNLIGFLVVAALVFGFTADTRGSETPWSEAVSAASPKCDTAETVDIQIPPLNWYSRLDCELLRQ